MRDALASALIERFDRPDMKSIVLMGSHARGDAGPYSDVDLARFISESGDLNCFFLRRAIFKRRRPCRDVDG
jgi:predicted nucleotidyltransferase